VDGTGAAFDREKYGYDRVGNREYADNLINDGFDELYHANGSSAGYDRLDRLISFRRGALSDENTDGVLDTVSSASRTQAWNFDALGNMKSVTSDGVTQSRTHNMQNEITGNSSTTTPAYNSAGNMTVDESGRTFTYDAWSRVILVNGTARYAYDGANRRIQEGARSLYYSASWQVVEERASGVAVVRNVWSPAYIDGLVLRDRDADANGSLEERLYALQDGNWNVQTIVGVDGSVKERYAFDPYGTRTVLTASWSATTTAYAWSLGHQGGRLDVATDMYTFRNRDLSPSLMRWNRNDPIEYKSGTLNLVEYVASSPTMHTDPMGLVRGIGTALDILNSFAGAEYWESHNTTRLKECSAAKKKCGVVSMTQEFLGMNMYMWKDLIEAEERAPTPGLYIRVSLMRIFTSIAFATGGIYEPCCCETQQDVRKVKTIKKNGVVTSRVVNEGIESADGFMEDGYGRDHPSNRYHNCMTPLAYFIDKPGLGIQPGQLKLGDVVIVEYKWRFIVYDKCNNNAVVATLGPTSNSFTYTVPGSVSYTGIPNTVSR
jgi:RHS repeat-associated protein